MERSARGGSGGAEGGATGEEKGTVSGGRHWELQDYDDYHDCVFGTGYDFDAGTGYDVFLFFFGSRCGVLAVDTTLGRS